MFVLYQGLFFLHSLHLLGFQFSDLYSWQQTIWKIKLQAMKSLSHYFVNATKMYVLVIELGQVKNVHIHASVISSTMLEGGLCTVMRMWTDLSPFVESIMVNCSTLQLQSPGWLPCLYATRCLIWWSASMGQRMVIQDTGCPCWDPMSLNYANSNDSGN